MTLIIQEIEVTYFILNSLTYDLKKKKTTFQSIDRYIVK